MERELRNSVARSCVAFSFTAFTSRCAIGRRSSVIRRRSSVSRGTLTRWTCDLLVVVKGKGMTSLTLRRRMLLRVSLLRVLLLRQLLLGITLLGVWLLLLLRIHLRLRLHHGLIGVDHGLR